MENNYHFNYEPLSDQQVVNLVLSNTRNEEAMAYLLYERHKGVLMTVFFSFKPKEDWFSDCVSDLFILLKGTNLDWQPLASFEWRSTLATWLKRIAYREFPKTIKRMEMAVERGKQVDSIDAEDPQKKPMQIADGCEEDEDRRLQKVLLLEAVGRLEDDRRFVILKRLEGYRSKEIAEMLQQKWLMHHIVKYNNKGQPVVPDADYVNVCVQRAKEDLKSMLMEGCCRKR